MLRAVGSIWLNHWECVMPESAEELLSALKTASADVEADDQVRASVKAMLKALTQAVQTNLESLVASADDL